MSSSPKAADEFLKRAIEGFFYFRWEKTSWQFIIFSMMNNTKAAFSPPWTTGISTRAIFQILLNLTFHKPNPSIYYHNFLKIFQRDQGLLAIYKEFIYYRAGQKHNKNKIKEVLKMGKNTLQPNLPFRPPRLARGRSWRWGFCAACFRFERVAPEKVRGTTLKGASTDGEPLSVLREKPRTRLICGECSEKGVVLPLIPRHSISPSLIAAIRHGCPLEHYFAKKKRGVPTSLEHALGILYHLVQADYFGIRFSSLKSFLGLHPYKSIRVRLRQLLGQAKSSYLRNGIRHLHEWELSLLGDLLLQIVTYSYHNGHLKNKAYYSNLLWGKSEVPFSIPLRWIFREERHPPNEDQLRRFKLRGRVDLLLVRKSGEETWVDIHEHKIAGVDYFGAGKGTALQLQVYGTWAVIAFGTRPEMITLKAQVIRLNPLRVEMVDIPFGRSQYVKALEKITKAVAAYSRFRQRGTFPAKPSPDLCTRCDFNGFCSHSQSRGGLNFPIPFQPPPAAISSPRRRRRKRKRDPSCGECGGPTVRRGGHRVCRDAPLPSCRD